MDIRQIQYFVRVAELGSFSRASLALNIAQPALSRQVRTLEVELRQTLLLRNGRGVTPTEAGKMLLEHGRGILYQMERAREDLGRIGGQLAGRVTVGIPPSIAKLLVLPLTRAFRTQLPHARLSVSEGLSVPMQESLTAGRLDIAMLYNMLPTPDLETVPLQEEELHVVGPRIKRGGGDPKVLSLSDLAVLPLVIPSRPHAIRMLVETVLANAGLKPCVVLELEGISTILDVVREGAGYAVLPISAVATSGRSHQFSTWGVEPRRMVTRLSIAFSARRAATHTQKAMLELLTDLARTTLPADVAPERSGIATRANSP
jgi:LysR family nitrogen assimilation transcriptional regulator